MGLGEGLIVEPWQVIDGHIELPTKPGLGFDLIESEVEKTIEHSEELGGRTLLRERRQRRGLVALLCAVVRLRSWWKRPSCACRRSSAKRWTT